LIAPAGTHHRASRYQLRSGEGGNDDVQQFRTCVRTDGRRFGCCAAGRRDRPNDNVADNSDNRNDDDRYLGDGTALGDNKAVPVGFVTRLFVRHTRYAHIAGLHLDPAHFYEHHPHNDRRCSSRRHRHLQLHHNLNNRDHHARIGCRDRLPLNS
jgi:hypothetical protein